MTRHLTYAMLIAALLMVLIVDTRVLIDDFDECRAHGHSWWHCADS